MSLVAVTQSEASESRGVSSRYQVRSTLCLVSCWYLGMEHTTYRRFGWVELCFLERLARMSHWVPGRGLGDVATDENDFGGKCERTHHGVFNFLDFLVVEQGRWREICLFLFRLRNNDECVSKDSEGRVKCGSLTRWHVIARSRSSLNVSGIYQHRPLPVSSDELLLTEEPPVQGSVTVAVIPLSSRCTEFAVRLRFTAIQVSINSTCSLRRSPSENPLSSTSQPSGQPSPLPPP